MHDDERLRRPRERDVELPQPLASGGPRLHRRDDAVGCGDADLFARAAKLNYYEETSVGEFLLGSRPASEI